MALDLRAWATERGGNLTEAEIDSWLSEQLFVPLEQRADLLATSGRAVFQERIERLLIDTRSGSSDSDHLPARVAERIQVVAQGLGIPVAPVPPVYGAAAVRLRLGVGTALDDLDGWSTLVEKYVAFHAKRVDPVFRPVHTRLAERNARLIEDWLQAEGALKPGRLLAPGVANMLARPDVVRRVGQLWVLEILPTKTQATASVEASPPVEAGFYLPRATGERWVALAPAWDLAEVCRQLIGGEYSQQAQAAYAAILADEIEKADVEHDGDGRSWLACEIRRRAGTAITLPPVPGGRGVARERDDLALALWALLLASDEELGIEYPAPA